MRRNLRRYLSQHPELAVFYGEFSVPGSGPPCRDRVKYSGPGSGSNSEDVEIVSNRQVISGDLERTTREVILEDRGSWGPHQTSDHTLTHTSYNSFSLGFGSCDGPGFALRARYSSELAARGEIGRAARLARRQIVPHRPPLHETSPVCGRRRQLIMEHAHTRGMYLAS